MTVRESEAEMIRERVRVLAGEPVRRLARNLNSRGICCGIEYQAATWVEQSWDRKALVMMQATLWWRPTHTDRLRHPPQ